MFEKPKRKLTLAERIAAKFRTPEEKKVYNPLGELREGGLKVGDTLGLDVLDLSGKDFDLLAMHEGKIFADGKVFRLCDYDLQHTPGPEGGDLIQRRLRVFEKLAAGAGEQPFEMGLLWLDDSGAYREDLENECRRDDGKFVVDFDDPDLEDEVYDRVGNLRLAREVEFSTLVDADGDGTVQPDEVSSRNVSTYDYWREARDEAGQPYCKYLYVDIDRDNHTYEVWMGEEVSAFRILL